MAQVGLLNPTPSPVAFGTGPVGSVQVTVRLLVLSVPPVGDGADGTAGNAGP